MSDGDKQDRNENQAQQNLNQEDQGVVKDEEVYHNVNMGTQNTNLTPGEYAEETEEQGAMSEDEAEQLEEGIE